MSKPRDRARALRQNMTDAERFVWTRLRARRFDGYKFRRQVALGQYIVDFACFDARLILELDGGQHTLQQDYDAVRTRWLSAQGFRVLRFWNHEILEDWASVEEVIWGALQVGAGESPEQRRAES